ncbi:SDR family NAD(P)-dependent oxidoreductase [Saccharibacillus endophyticus]|uniref:Short-chain dehydrogenase n=1 Tax=Saccharibacillus endophyticus TaxID=2060666 RepID=A0ABQ1ZRA3_9BACL|nr:SDR family oxidoreductase [Saccharibacillus endophyticus]GGH72962.1 short-chain dehydrogenase [Saccharibacillus endophyticus]
MIDRYTGKTVLITGASSGIGECFSEELAAKGAHLILVARSSEKLNALAERLSGRYGIQAVAISLDLSVSGAAERLTKNMQDCGLQPDMLINNAGIGTMARFEEIDAARIEREVTLNIMTLTELTRYLLPNMLKRGSGLVINVASMTAFQPSPYMAVYGATKAYVLSFTEALWAENQNRGVQFLALCPGETQSSFHGSSGADSLNGKRMQPIEVVNAAFQAVEQQKNYRIAGRGNYWMGQLPRFFSRRSVLRIVERMLRSGLKHT